MSQNQVPVRPASRDAVYDVIDGERDYQDAKSEAITPGGASPRPHSVEEFVIYMVDYTREMKAQLTHTWTPDRKAPPEALDTLRKIVARGIACMEQNGARPREWHVPASANISGTVNVTDPASKLGGALRGIAEVRP